MARKPTRPPKAGAATAAPRGGGSERERIIAAFMALLAEKPIEQIGFAEIAEGAGVSLAELRNAVRLDGRDPRRAHEGDRPRGAGGRRCRHGARSRRASGCSTC